MKIVLDKYIPYVAEVLLPYAEVLALDPLDITPEAVHDADALIIRTRTQCNEALLAGSKVQFIATATIGFDHIDADYCTAHNIHWVSCPGCNAQGVADYVETAINTLVETPYMASPKTPTIGIIGCGHVGSKVAAMAQHKGYRILISDPPREAQGEIQGTPLMQIAKEADIITFHTPLSKEGNHPTYHLVSSAFFAHCKPHALIINAARGGVIDEKALLDFLNTHPQAEAVIDCWEGEPIINQALLQRAAIATFHIAGYTVEGKYNASRMCLEAWIQHFNIESSIATSLLQALQANYQPSLMPQVGFDIQQTSLALKEAPEIFESLRKQYVLR